jgi:hypothetical protein
MMIKRMGHVSVVDDDLPAAIAFFTTLGMAREGEESIFSLETEKNLPGTFYELPEAAVRTKNFPEIKFSRRLVEFRSGRSSL